MSQSGAEGAEAWSLAAAGWERHRDVIAALGGPVTARLVDLLDLAGSETVLELACGNGEVGLAVVAELPQGRLIQSDLVPEMIDVARREADRRGLRNVSHCTLDVEELGLHEESVDAVVCRWGYMLTADPGRALMETSRVLRPGGAVALSVWAERGRNPWATIVGRALLELGLVEPPDTDAPGPFRLDERNHLIATVAGAGLVVETEEEIAVSWPAMPASVFWETALDTSPTLRDTVRTLSAPDLDELRRLVEAALSEYAGDDGTVHIPGVCRVVLARKPDSQPV